VSLELTFGLFNQQIGTSFKKLDGSGKFAEPEYRLYPIEYHMRRSKVIFMRNLVPQEVRSQMKFIKEDEHGDESSEMNIKQECKYLNVS